MSGGVDLKVTCISGSPRREDYSNTDYLLNVILDITGGEILKLNDYKISPCKSCWKCVDDNKCIIEDDMTNFLIPEIIESDVIILGSPVFFNNVTAQLKAFIDRTWSIRGKLKNKIGAAVVVGRKYGAESAITAINAFYLKHEIIPANRGICGMAFKKREIKKDDEAIKSSRKLGKRILELDTIVDI